MTIATAAAAGHGERRQFPGRFADPRLANGRRQGGKRCNWASRQPRRPPSTLLTQPGRRGEPSLRKATRFGFQGTTLGRAELDQILWPGGDRADGPQRNQACRCQPAKKPASQPFADAARTGPSLNSDSAEERQPNQTNTLNPFNSRGDPPSGQDPETSAETDAVVLSNELVVPPDAAGKRP